MPPSRITIKLCFAFCMVCPSKENRSSFPWHLPGESYFVFGDMSACFFVRQNIQTHRQQSAITTNQESVSLPVPQRRDVGISGYRMHLRSTNSVVISPWWKPIEPKSVCVCMRNPQRMRPNRKTHRKNSKTKRCGISVIECHAH